ncbi:DUF2341 domain-containing protein, partial [Candidatus Woesearchaeota archaeon]
MKQRGVWGLLFLLVLVSAAAAPNTNITGQAPIPPIDKLYPESITRTLTYFQPSDAVTISQPRRAPITFGEPVEWQLHLTINGTNHTVVYTTPPILASAVTTTRSTTWIKDLFFWTRAVEPYVNITYTVNLSANYSRNFTIEPPVPYALYPDHLKLFIPELRKQLTLRLTGDIVPEEGGPAPLSEGTTNESARNATQSANTTNNTGDTGARIQKQLRIEGVESEHGHLRVERADTNFLIEVQGLAPAEDANVTFNLSAPLPEHVVTYAWDGDRRIPMYISPDRRRLLIKMNEYEDGVLNHQVQKNLTLILPNFTANVTLRGSNEAIADVDGQRVIVRAQNGEISTVRFVDPRAVKAPIPHERFYGKLFKIDLATTTGAVDVTVTLDSLPKRFELWKYNPLANEWYRFPFTRLDSRTLRLTLVDGGQGDDDGVKNGVIKDDFAIVLVSSAELLDSERQPLKDISANVTAKDNHTAHADAGEYLRVTFERPLTNRDDITLWASGTDARVIVYTENGTEPITRFTNITPYGKYRALLTSLAGAHDTFDLHVARGAVDVDQVLDPNWWNASWHNRREINITNVGTTTLTDFPALLNITKLAGMQADYDDLRFLNGSCTDPHGVLVDHEFDTKTVDDVLVWVRIPIFPTTGAQLCMYYNNTAAPNGENRSGVWRNGYVGVWHMTNTTESTKFSHETTENGTVTRTANGMIGGAYSFDGTNDWLQVTDHDWLTTGNYLTVEAWVYDTAGDTNPRGIVSKRVTSGSNEEYSLFKYTTEYLFLDISGERNNDATSLITNGEWLSIAAVFDGTLASAERMKVYFNASLDATLTYTTSGMTNQGADVFIGILNANYGNSWQGRIDEVRISNTTRSADWLNQTFELITNQAAIVTFGAVELGPGTLNITFDEPAHLAELTRNTGTTMNGTVLCAHGDCGNVTVVYQYFSTSSPLSTFVDNTSTEFQNMTSAENITLGSSLTLRPNTASAPADWWNASWSYRRTINITNPHSQNLTDFPAYVYVTKATAMQADYDDLRFLNASCGASGGDVLNHEIESADSAGAHVWVRIPNLHNGTNQLCLYYGNSTVASNENKSGVWRDNYMGVWHLTNTSDSTANNNDGTVNGGATTASGFVGGAYSFDGTNDWIQVADAASLTANQHLTIESWVYDTAGDAQPRGIVSKRVSSASGEEYYTFKYTGEDFYLDLMNDRDADTVPITANEWWYITSTFDGTLASANRAAVYYNGSFSTYMAKAFTSFTDQASDLHIGILNANYGAGWQGRIDEVRLSNVTRSNAYINETYILMAAQASFVSFEPEEHLPYTPSGTYTSKVFDTGFDSIQFENMSWSGVTNATSNFTVFVRTAPSLTSLWWNTSYARRVEINVTNTAEDLYEYQVLVEKNLSAEYLLGNITEDCADVRFTWLNSTSNAQETVPFYTDVCNLTATDNATFWVKIPFLENDTTTKIYLYYGSPGAPNPSNITQTFTYDSPRRVAYIVNNQSVSSGLRLTSLMDGNTIVVGTTTYAMDRLDQQTIISGIDVDTAINATKPFQAEGGGDTDSEVVPVSWAGTTFYYAGMRDSADELCYLSPWGTATVDVYNAGSLVATHTVTAKGLCDQRDFTNGRTARIESDIPILIAHLGPGQGRDSWAFYPATTEPLWGASVSTAGFVAAGANGASITCEGHNKSQGTASVGTDNDYNCATPLSNANNNGGLAEAWRVTSSDYPIGAIQQADGDGADSSVLVPRKEMGTLFGSAQSIEYFAAVSPYNGTNCTLYDSGGKFASDVTDGNGTAGIFKLCIGCGGTADISSGPWYAVCSAPVWPYYEEGSTEDETGLLGEKQMRQYTYPEPTLSVGKAKNYTAVVNNFNDLSWTAWYQQLNGTAIPAPDGRYIQYRADFVTADTNETPRLDDITIGYFVTATDWVDMASSGTLFTTTNPYECGVMLAGATCTPSRTVVPRSTGNFSLRLTASSNETDIPSVTTLEHNISVWLQPVLSTFTSSEDPIVNGSSTVLSVTLYDDTGQPLSGYTINFTDMTGNGSVIKIGTNTTDASGVATITYTPPDNTLLQTHTLNASYAGNPSIYYRPADITTDVLVTSQPNISSITISPSATGFGLNITITATITDNVGLDTYRINYTDESGTSTLAPLTAIGGNQYQYVFNDSWLVQDYTFHIIANNTDGISTTSGEEVFSIAAQANVSFTTARAAYANNKVVYLDISTNWFYTGWSRRIPFTIENTAEDLYEYQVYLNASLSDEYLNGRIQEGCADARFTWYNTSSAQEEAIDYVIDVCNLSQSGTATFWAKVPLMLNNTNTTVYLYYGNSTATDAGNMTATFSYRQPRTVAYVVSDRMVSTNLDLVSYEDGNTILVDATSYSLNNLQSQTNLGGNSRGTVINAT